MTTAEAAEALGVTRRRVLQFINEKRLRAKRRGRDYWITEAEIERFKALPRKEGRPASKRGVIESEKGSKEE